MAEIIGIPVFLVLRASWRRDERDRERYQRGEDGPDPRHRSKHWYWGGMGRPGR